MSTIEKLLVQIFERKNSIIEQVKHQVELYDQQLASKLVIQGFDPPSWLWNHEAPSRCSDRSEVDKHRLISGLLRPHPQQAVPYFNNINFNSISLSECNFNQQDEPISPTCFDDVHNVPDICTEVEPAASSPQQQVATRLGDDNSGLDLSHAEFKRSKSRQRALELRSRSKSAAKSREQDENISVVSYRNRKPEMDEFQRSNNIEKPDSAKYSNIQLDDSAKCKGIKRSCCVENKANEGYGNIGIFTDNECSGAELLVVVSEEVNKSMQSTDPLSVSEEGDPESAGVRIQSCNGSDSSRSMGIKHVHHDESVGQVCKSECYGSESSGRISKPTRSSDNLGVCGEGDAESEGFNIRWIKENNTSEEIPNLHLEHVSESVVKPPEFQETSNIQHGVIESKRRKISSSAEDSVSGAIPSQQCNNEMDYTEPDICCTNNIVGVGSGGQIDECSIEGSLLAVTHGNCSTDATLDVHRLSSIGEVPRPGGISCSGISFQKLSDVAPSLYAASKDNEIGSAVSFSSLQDYPHVLESLDLMTSSIIGDRNFDMIKVQTKGPSSSDKTLTKFSANPVNTKISLGGNSELVRNSPAENDSSFSGVSLSWNISQSHDRLLKSLKPASLAVSIASTGKESDDCASRKKSPKSSGVNSEVHTSSCGLEGGNSLLEELNAPKTEVEVPRMQSVTVEQSAQQTEDANLGASDYPLLNGAVQNQERMHIVQVISCCGTSKATEDSYHFQDNIEVEENLASEAATFQLKATTSSFGKILGKVETKSLMLSSHEAKQATEDSVMIEKSSKCFLEGSHLSLDVEANLNKEHYDHETFSIENALGEEPYTDAFEENAFIDFKYDGMMDDDQSMPVFEGFVMEPDDDESVFAEGQMDMEESSSNLRRASVLERLCQSSSRNTPVSQFPMTYGLHKTSDLFQSVPTGLLEHISQLGDCTDMKLQQKSHSACLPVSTNPFSFSESTPYASPFVKKWDRITSSSGPKSQGSLNPELVCFTIKEDSGNCDEAAEAPPSHSSCLRSSLKRKPLTDITEDDNYPHLSVTIKNKDVLEAGQTPKFCFRSQLDSTLTEANETGAQTRARQKLGKKISNKKQRIHDIKENRNVSVGPNGDKQVTDSLKETKSKKPKYSENLKTTTGASDQQKVLRSNNIVSNVSSFIPLVQQKKAAAAVVTGKRDVKVKALEAAEAAKRLAEKKENERKAKKEAWKAEKARLEQENLLQLELKKKKKEEELKKKEAEMVARKRTREEEEKKEKEGKRRRIEEARKQQHEQGKKQADKLMRHQADGLRIHEKDPNNGMEQCTKMETGGRKGRVTTQSEVKAIAVPCDMKTMLCDLKERNTIMKADIGDSNLNSAVSDLNTTAEKNPKDEVEVLQSYDISPYEGSDDEDEDDENENDRRKEKFVPAWASKNSLAEAVFSQQHINPDEIFPPGSFCRISEVLIPRKLLVK